MKIVCLLLFLFVTQHSLIAQSNPIGIFHYNTDIGNPKNSGSASFNGNDQSYSLKGSGYNIWFGRDEFNYTYRKISGDFILTANLEFVGEGKDPHRKIGLMIRESDDDNAAHASATIHGDGLTVLQWRVLAGALMRDPKDEVFSPKHHYSVLQLERAGKKIIMRAAHDGEELQFIGSHVFPDMQKEVLIGLFICSHNEEVVEEAKAWNVRLDLPVEEGYDPEKEGYLGCRLETMNVFDGQRMVIYKKQDRFEAPNWMPDGQRLLFNMDGDLYTIPSIGGPITFFKTGEANRLNNDHGISFDGKLLAFSHHVAGLPEGGSTIYVMPLAGGTPQQITTETPSYWHGWSPNNREVVFVAKRNKSPNYQIFQADIQSKKEKQLTFNKGWHVDGPEYSPDGQYIYYNGSQSGTMQIWRMHPDGTHAEQLTFDAYNDWFPHISPDGKWMVFLSFVSPIPVDDHPSYKRVMLRLMPTSGGAPKVIAYLYGGQGTINVPSWSPDSKHIAFVSNSGRSY